MTTADEPVEATDAERLEFIELLLMDVAPSAGLDPNPSAAPGPGGAPVEAPRRGETADPMARSWRDT